VLLALHLESGRGPVVRSRRGAAGGREPAVGDRITERYRAALDEPGTRLLVAVLADEPVGVALLLLHGISSSVDTQPCLHVAHLLVAARTRRRGVGRALLAEAVAVADCLGLDAVSVGVRPGDREANRYFARLGFAPVAVRRLAPVALLRRQLGQPTAPVARNGGGPGSPVLRRRLRTAAHPNPDRKRDAAGT
jgi:GNAT superfamily N-acetyltransferase